MFSYFYIASLFFVLFLFFSSSLNTIACHSTGYLCEQQIPSFSQYTHLKTLSQDQFPVDDSDKRTIVVGDIHGMNDSLSQLLDKISYSPHTDILIHAGDIITRGHHYGSLQTLHFMATNNITGVRGNNDQKVIEWRGWIDWIFTMPDGGDWLVELENRWLDELAERRGYHDHDSNDDFKRKKKKTPNVKKWLEAQKEHFPKSVHYLWNLIPRKWLMFSDHYRIARAMSDMEFQYLLNLPLVLYAPNAHTFIVHAGILSSDVQYDYWDKKQPLAREPPLGERDIQELRNYQESALLKDVKQNRDPWVLLNMRSILNGEVIRNFKGTAWSKLWERDMESCVGFVKIDRVSLASQTPFGIDNALRSRWDTGPKEHPLPCYPFSVIYAHAAKRGLDVKRWTFGLDSGCVYNRKLSALVIGGGLGEGDDIEIRGQHHDGSIVPFGDNGKAQIVSIKCHG